MWVDLRPHVGLKIRSEMQIFFPVQCEVIETKNKFSTSSISTSQVLYENDIPSQPGQFRRMELSSI